MMWTNVPSRHSGPDPESSDFLRKPLDSRFRGNDKSRVVVVICTASLMLLLAASPEMSVALERKIPDNHPIALTAAPLCTECHTEDTGVALKPISTFNHSADFISGHRFYAAESSRLCNACHKVSFCTDCHAYKDDMKPSEKYSGSPERWLPHRGDYLFQHRIDGRLDPTSCYRCHGTQNNRLCKQCHR